MLYFLIVVFMPGICTNVTGSVNGKAPKEVTKDQLLRFIRQVNRDNCKVKALTSKIRTIKTAQYRVKRREAKRALDDARKSSYIDNQCLKLKIQTQKGEMKTYSTMSKDELYCELILRYVDTKRVKDLLRRSGVSLADQPTQTLNRQMAYLPDVDVIKERKYAKIQLPNTIVDPQSTQDFFVFSENNDYVELNEDVKEPNGDTLPKGITGRIINRGSGSKWVVKFPYPADRDFYKPTPKDRADVPTADVTINFWDLKPSKKKRISFIGRRKMVNLNEIDSDDIDTEDLETDDETDDETEEDDPDPNLTLPKIASIGKKKTASPMQPILTRQKKFNTQQIITRKQAYEQALKTGSKPPSTQTAAKTPSTSAKTPKPTSAKTTKTTPPKTPKKKTTTPKPPKKKTTPPKKNLKKPKAGSSATLRRQLGIKKATEVVQNLSKEIKDIGLEKEIDVSDLGGLVKSVKKGTSLMLRKQMIAQIDNGDIDRNKHPYLGIMRSELKYIRDNLNNSTLTNLVVRVKSIDDLVLTQLVVENPSEPFLAKGKYPFFLFKKRTDPTR